MTALEPVVLDSNILVRIIRGDTVGRRVVEDYDLSGRAERPIVSRMGQNDMWIAATVSVLDGVLLTTDDDFDHLDGHFVKLKKIDPRTGETT